jgi:KaiC/GvpD/RAD55 family RecA-like ATPase
MKLVRMIVATLLNKYDFFMIIEGGTGIGKSTLAFHIASKVAQEFRRLYKLDEDVVEYYYERVGRKMGLSEEEFVAKILLLKQNREYRFHPTKALIYTQDELQNALASWHGISIPDEMINITFNRDFYSEKQKDIIKMLNMFRDHENLTIACVPQFQTLDNQIKNLCKMKITVKKRGIAIIHTPNSTVYCKDKWDQATNEKIEREWIVRKITRPNYSKLTTFRGLVRFPPLSRKQEAMYQKIKNDKRSIVLRDDMGIEMKDTDDPFQKIVKKLLDGGVRNGHIIDGFAEGMGLTSAQLRSRIVNELRKNNKPTSLSYYFWDKKAKNKEETQEFEGI